MKKDFRFIFFFGLLLMCFSECLDAQIQAYKDPTLAALQNSKKVGVVAVWMADRGVFLAGTNVYSWTDLTDNGFNLNQYGGGIQPTLSTSYSTNNFPAIVFTAAASATQQRLRADSLSAYYTGNTKPYTFIVLCCGQTNGTCNIVSLGWTQATNTAASQIVLRPNSTTVTSSQIGVATVTNLAVGSQSFSGGISTNTYGWFSTTSDGTNYRLYQNLSVSTNMTGLGGTITLDTFTLGGLCRTNANFVLPWFGGVTALMVYSNQLSGTQVTNEINAYNAIYKVY